MSVIITSGNLPQLLLPGVAGIYGDYDFYNSEWSMMYVVQPSSKRVEIEVEKQNLNAAAQFGEGEQIPVGDIKQKFVTYSEMFNYGVGFVITALAIEDNLYPEEFPKGMLAIKENMRNLQEQEGIALFDNAFTSADPEYLLADGQPMCSTSHPIQGGTVSNTLTATQLNETSAEDMIKGVQNFRDAAGLRIRILPQKYLVGIENQFVAQVLTGSTYDPSSANNAVNPLTYGNYMPGGFIVNHYAQNQYNFFVLTSYKQGLVHYRRKSLEIQMTTDQATRNLGIYGNERYRFRCRNFRAVFGVQSFG